MMDAIDDRSPSGIFEDGAGPSEGKRRSETVDLNVDSSLLVDISDAMSERDKVLFTVHTKTTLSVFKKPEFSVTRLHEEFVWLHDQFEDSEEYAGFILPPAPPRPDFDASREKLQKLSEGEGTMTKVDFQKMKAELEAEYLATFKKTVAMHEVFLQRLAAHPVLRNNVGFRVFLEYEQELSVRGKNKKERVAGFLRTVSKTADENLLLSNQREEDEFFKSEKCFLVNYHSQLKMATGNADQVTQHRKAVAESYIGLSSALSSLASIQGEMQEARYLEKMAEFYEKLRKIESRIASDEDLKLSDTLRYYMNDSSAAKDLLYRRSRALADYETANKNLEKARVKGREVVAAEEAQTTAYEKFKTLSDTARTELEDFKKRRIEYFKKNLVDLGELELKHAKTQMQLIRAVLTTMKSNTLDSDSS